MHGDASSNVLLECIDLINNILLKPKIYYVRTYVR